MDRTRSLEQIMTGLLNDEIVLERLVKEFGDDTQRVINDIRMRRKVEFNGVYIIDIFEDLLCNDARVYRSYMTEEEYGEYPIFIMGLGSVCYYCAPEFDRVGYFSSIEEAASSLEWNFMGIDDDKTVDHSDDDGMNAE